MTRQTIIILVSFLAACSRPHPDAGQATAALAPKAAPSDDPVGPVGTEYPPARWRLASFEDLDRTPLWISHIAIRHEQSSESSLRVLDWLPDPPRPQRSVAEAFAIAERVGAEAQRDPSRFAQLARQYSEDVVTRERGGSFGGIRASQLMGTGFLDVLAALRPGQVSKVFRTPYGFHVLKRNAAPPPADVAGARIVIGYENTHGLAAPVTRTREAARTLAERVAAEARATPDAFEALVDRHSDADDRQYHGSLGVLSTADPAYFPAEVEELAQLRVGEISAPMDSRFGFEILKRLPAPAARPDGPILPRLQDLPSPAAPDFDAFLGYNESEQIADMARAFAEDARAEQGLSDCAATIGDVFKRLAKALDANREDPDFKREQVHGAIAELRRKLGPGGFTRFADFGTRWVIEQMMPPGSAQ